MASLHFESALLPTGWARDVQVALADGIITQVSAGTAPGATDERHKLAVPGMASLHSHAFQRGMAGLAETRGNVADTFWTWRETMYRFALAMTPEEAEAVATLLYVEMLEQGFTRVGEFHYLHHDRDGRPYGNLAEMAERIVAAAAATGIGLTLLPTFYAHGSFGGAAPHDGQRRFICSVDLFAKLMAAAREAARALPGTNLGIAPHSLRAVAPEELLHIVPLAEGGPVHIHAAEQVREVEDCVAWSGRRPVQWLLDHAEVDDRWQLVHATHMTADETSRLAASGAVAGLCPITAANLGDGGVPAEAYLAAGGAMGIGTDSNVMIDAAEELRLMEYAQRLTYRRRNVLASSGRPSVGGTLFGKAVQGGARALGVEGGLAVGAPADLVA